MNYLIFLIVFTGTLITIGRSTVTSKSHELCFKKQISMTDTIDDIFDKLCINKTSTFVYVVSEFRIFDKVTIEYILKYYRINMTNSINQIEQKSGVPIEELLRVKLKRNKEFNGIFKKTPQTIEDFLNNLYINSLIYYNQLLGVVSKDQTIGSILNKIGIDSKLSLLDFVNNYVYKIDYTFYDILYLLNFTTNVPLNKLKQSRTNLATDEKINVWLLRMFTFLTIPLSTTTHSILVNTVNSTNKSTFPRTTVHTTIKKTNTTKPTTFKTNSTHLTATSTNRTTIPPYTTIQQTRITAKLTISSLKFTTLLDYVNFTTTKTPQNTSKPNTTLNSTKKTAVTSTIATTTKMPTVTNRTATTTKMPTVTTARIISVTTTHTSSIAMNHTNLTTNASYTSYKTPYTTIFSSVTTKIEITATNKTSTTSPTITLASIFLLTSQKASKTSTINKTSTLPLNDAETTIQTTLYKQITTNLSTGGYTITEKTPTNQTQSTTNVTTSYLTNSTHDTNKLLLVTNSTKFQSNYTNNYSKNQTSNHEMNSFTTLKIKNITEILYDTSNTTKLISTGTVLNTILISEITENTTIQKSNYSKSPTINSTRETTTGTFTASTASFESLLNTTTSNNYRPTTTKQKVKTATTTTNTTTTKKNTTIKSTSNKTTGSTTKSTTKTTTSNNTSKGNPAVHSASPVGGSKNRNCSQIINMSTEYLTTEISAFPLTIPVSVNKSSTLTTITSYWTLDTSETFGLSTQDPHNFTFDTEFTPEETSIETSSDTTTNTTLSYENNITTSNSMNSSTTMEIVYSTKSIHTTNTPVTSFDTTTFLSFTEQWITESTVASSYEPGSSSTSTSYNTDTQTTIIVSTTGSDVASTNSIETTDTFLTTLSRCMTEDVSTVDSTSESFSSSLSIESTNEMTYASTEDLTSESFSSSVSFQSTNEMTYASTEESTIFVTSTTSNVFIIVQTPSLIPFETDSTISTSIDTTNELLTSLTPTPTVSNLTTEATLSESTTEEIETSVDFSTLSTEYKIEDSGSTSISVITPVNNESPEYTFSSQPSEASINTLLFTSTDTSIFQNTLITTNSSLNLIY